MPTENFVKYMMEAKGLFFMKYNKKVEDIKFKEETDFKVIFIIKAERENELFEIEVEK